MTNEQLTRYIRTLSFCFSFIKLNVDVDAIIKEERAKDASEAEQNKEIKTRFKKEVRKQVLDAYNKDNEGFFKKMGEVLNDEDIDVYLKTTILNMSIGVINRQKELDYATCKRIISKNGPIKKLLNSLFIEEDDENTVEGELNEKYNHLSTLFKAYKQEFYVKENNENHGGLTMKEVKVLIDKYRNEHDLEARDKIIEANIGLAKNVAYHYYSKINSLISYEDLIQDGLEGLMRAVEKFDYTQGVRFSTYAMWWIRQSVMRSCETYFRALTIPVNKVSNIMTIHGKIQKLERETGKTPTKKVIMEKLHLSEETYEEYKRLIRLPESLNRKINKEDGELGEELGSTLKSDDSVEEMASKKVDSIILQEDLEEALNARENFVIRERFGFNDPNAREKTLEAVGKELNITRERVRQIQAKSLRKLKNYYRKKGNSIY